MPKNDILTKIFANLRKKGYATESLSKILDFGFDELKLHRIGAGCVVDNKASARVLEKDRYATYRQASKNPSIKVGL